jgi:hypothetical protein
MRETATTHTNQQAISIAYGGKELGQLFPQRSVVRI